MGAINRLPNGLLSYVDTKTQGQNPAFLGEQVSPVLDMEPFYRSLARYEMQVSQNVAAGPNSYTNIVAVPNDEVWLLHAASVEFANTVGPNATNVWASCNLWTGPQASISLLNTSGAVSGITVTTGEQVYFSGIFARPVVASPGWNIAVWMGNFAGAATLQVRQSLLVNRCSI